MRFCRECFALHATRHGPNNFIPFAYDCQASRPVRGCALRGRRRAPATHFGSLPAPVRFQPDSSPLPAGPCLAHYPRHRLRGELPRSDAGEAAGLGARVLSGAGSSLFQGCDTRPASAEPLTAAAACRSLRHVPPPPFPFSMGSTYRDLRGDGGRVEVGQPAS